jgi:hypothetical protein
MDDITNVLLKQDVSVDPHTGWFINPFGTVSQYKMNKVRRSLPVQQETNDEEKPDEALL